MTPALAALTPEAIVWLMLFSTMERRRMRPRRMPKPRMAAISEPTMVKPIFSPV